jgi:hypothetical protein
MNAPWVPGGAVIESAQDAVAWGAGRIVHDVIVQSGVTGAPKWQNFRGRGFISKNNS